MWLAFYFYILLTIYSLYIWWKNAKNEAGQLLLKNILPKITQEDIKFERKNFLWKSFFISDLNLICGLVHENKDRLKFMQ
jgi:hypothetical protein